jgi:uncharacterized membrane protein
VESAVFQSATVQDVGMCWDFRRNRSVTPRQLATCFALLACVSLGIGLLFWLQGALFVLPFACLELLALGVAFVVYARHALDGERIWVEGGLLVVESERAGQTVRCEFQRAWVRIEPLVPATALIEICGQGQRVQVGHFVRNELRYRLAQELRRAVALS